MLKSIERDSATMKLDSTCTQCSPMFCFQTDCMTWRSFAITNNNSWNGTEYSARVPCALALLLLFKMPSSFYGISCTENWKKANSFMSPTVAFSIVSHKLKNHHSLRWVFQLFDLFPSKMKNTSRFHAWPNFIIFFLV